MLFAQFVNGIVSGSGFALMAVGLSYTLGLARIFNFAYGTAYVFAAYLAIKISGSVGLGYYVASLVALLAMIIGGAIFALGVVYPAIRRSDVTVMIATLGADIALTNIGQKAFGSQVQSLASPLTKYRLHVWHATINAQGLASIVGTLVVAAALQWFIRRTKLGTQLRAAGENRELASTSGIDVLRSFVIAVVVGIVVAGIAAFLYAPLSVVSSSTGDNVLLVAFAIIAIAGVGELWGAVAVAFAVGIFDSLFVAYVNPSYANVVVYGFLIVLLIIRPRGLLSGYA